VRKFRKARAIGLLGVAMALQFVERDAAVVERDGVGHAVLDRGIEELERLGGTLLDQAYPAQPQFGRAGPGSVAERGAVVALGLGQRARRQFAIGRADARRRDLVGLVAFRRRDAIEPYRRRAVAGVARGVAQTQHRLVLMRQIGEVAGRTVGQMQRAAARQTEQQHRRSRRLHNAEDNASLAHLPPPDAVLELASSGFTLSVRRRRIAAVVMTLSVMPPTRPRNRSRGSAT